MGESELVLDRLNVEDVMRILGAVGRPGVQAKRPSLRELAEEISEEAVQDWRSSLRQAGVNVDAPVTATKPVADAEFAPRDSPETSNEMAFKKGIVVASDEAELIPSVIEKLDTLDEIAKRVNKCTRCPLYETATKGVPGEGNPKAKLVCVGEAPGAKEDETGRPFVGAAGQLLTKILAAIKLEREDVFICNVLKHRPPGNRNPRPEGVAACSPYLVRQLELIRPKVILALGTFAAQTLLETTLSIGDELSRHGELDASGGRESIAVLTDAVPTAANVEYHARIVREKALTRRLIEVSTAIVAEAFEGRQTAAELLDDAEQKIFQV